MKNQLAEMLLFVDASHTGGIDMIKALVILIRKQNG